MADAAKSGNPMGAIGSLLAQVAASVNQNGQISVTDLLSGNAARRVKMGEMQAQLQQLQMEDIQARQQKEAMEKAMTPMLQQSAGQLTGRDPSTFAGFDNKALRSLLSQTISSQEAGEVAAQNAEQQHGFRMKQIGAQGAETRKNQASGAALDLKNAQAKQAMEQQAELKKQQTAFANLVASGMDTETARAIVTNPGVANTLLGGTPNQQAGAARDTLQAGLESGAVDTSSPLGKLIAAQQGNAPSQSDQQLLDTFLKTQPRFQAQGTPEQLGLASDKTTKRKMDDEITAATETIADMEGLLSDLDGSMLTTGGALMQGVNKGIARTLGAGALSDSGRKSLEAFTGKKTQAKLSFLKIRKFFTGVAGGDAELAFIQDIAPDFDKDDEITLVSKARTFTNAAKLTVDRLNALKTGGVSMEDITDDARRRIVEESVQAALGGARLEKVTPEEAAKIKAKRDAGSK